MHQRPHRRHLLFIIIVVVPVCSTRASSGTGASAGSSCPVAALPVPERLPATRRLRLMYVVQDTRVWKCGGSVEAAPDVRGAGRASVEMWSMLQRAKIPTAPLLRCGANLLVRVSK